MTRKQPEDGQNAAEQGRKSRRRTRSSNNRTRGQRASHDSSLASTEDEDENGNKGAQARRRSSRHAEEGPWVPDLDSPVDDRFPSPDRQGGASSKRRSSSPLNSSQRPSNSVERPKGKRNVLRGLPDQPSYIPSGSSLGLSMDPSSAYAQSESNDSSAVNSSDADGKSMNGSHTQHSSRQLQVHERTPLLKKRSHPGQLHQAIREEDEAIYGSSPPDTVPFPRRSPGISLRKRSSGAKIRRKSSAASRFNPQGSSTFGQTLFNAINVLIGIGILALREHSSRLLQN